MIGNGDLMLLAVFGLGVLFAFVFLYFQFYGSYYLREFATQLGGTLVTDPISGAPTLKFSSGGIRTELRINAGSMFGRRTLLRFDLPSATAFRLSPNTFFGQVLSLFAGHSVKTGSRTLDERFRVEGTAPGEIGALLDPPARRAILSVWKLIRDYTSNPKGRSRRLITDETPDVVVDWGPAGLSISAGVRLQSDLPVLMEFITRGRALAYHWNRPAPCFETLHEGRCLVCLGSFGAGTVRCARCRTPHHSECWKYFGGCAIFGCRSARLERVAASKQDVRSSLKT